MTPPANESAFAPVVQVLPAPDSADCLLVCEHASNRVPGALGGLGLDAAALHSHVAWDPGALGVARGLAERLAAPLVHGAISRLVYDCNRPPEAPDAIPQRSEAYEIPGNLGLSAEARAARVAGVYAPFRAALAGEIFRRRGALRLMVTVHSFTPVYLGVARAVEIGILHGRDAGMARAMLAERPAELPHEVRLNEPYGAADGVAHTLDEHGGANGLASVMIEIRNDLIVTPAAQAAMAARLAPWITRAAARLTEEPAA